MLTVRILLLEDNVVDALKIEMMLGEMNSKYTYILAAVFDTLPPLLEYLQHNQVDIVISDIFIKSRPVGFELFQSVILRHIPIILTTSSHDRSVYNAAQQYRSVHYLVKPFHALTLQSVLEKILEEKAKDKQHDFDEHKFFYLSGVGGQRIQVRFDEIIYLSSESNNCFIYTATRKYVIKKSLTKLLKDHLKDDFLRVHQQYVVNKLHLKNIKNDTIVLTGGGVVPIGKSFRKEVMTFLKVH